MEGWTGTVWTRLVTPDGLINTKKYECVRYAHEFELC